MPLYDVEKSNKALKMIRAALKRRDQNPELRDYKPRITDADVQRITGALVDAGGELAPRPEPVKKSDKNIIRTEKRLLENRTDGVDNKDARPGHMASPLVKSFNEALAKAKACNEMMEKSQDPEERLRLRKERDSYVVEGLKRIRSLLPEKLAKAQYAKTAPVEERKEQQKIKDQEAKNKSVVAKQIKKDAIEVLGKMPGHNPGKGIASETPKKTMREPNKVKPGESINPRKSE